MEELILRRDSLDKEKSEVRKVVEEAFFKHQEIFEETYKGLDPTIFLTSNIDQIDAKYKWRI